MEQAQSDVTAPEHLDQRDLRLVELPPGCEVTAVLVAVGVAQHHLLRTAAALQQALVFRQRSEEHTSELQSHLNLVCRLLLEKKKDQTHYTDSPDRREQTEVI